MKDKIFSVLQRIGRSFMLPIAILPVAGLLLGLGSSFTNPTTITTYHLERILGNGTLLHSLLVIMNRVGSAVFDNLPLIFAAGVAIGMAQKEKEVAALSAVIAFFVMHISINGILNLTGEILEDGSISPDVLEGTIAPVCGIMSLQMGVFGGIIVGLGVAALHNRYYKIVLPDALSFFGGSRFIPIISTITYMFVGILLYFVWPLVQNGIYALGGLVTGTGYWGTLLFGIVKRALIPFGLHHVFYLPFWQTAVGGTMDVGGQLVMGGQNIFFAQLANSADIAHFSADATRYFSGEFIFMIFGLPGAALAMYQTARPEKKKAAGGLLLSAALTCMLTGITEPIEFSFLFVAPILFGVQVLLAGSAYMIAHILNIAVGLTFSGGLIDLILFGVLQGNDKTSWLRIIPVGIIYFLLYYVLFLVLIRKLDLKTPGREADTEETRLYTKADVQARSRQTQQTGNGQDAFSALLETGLGGRANIADVDCCATRLRITVKDPALVQETVLRQTNPKGILKKGPAVQIVYGPQVSVIKSNLEDYLQNAAAAAPTVIATPITGTIIPLSEVPDEVFSSEMMGPGAAIIPSEGKVYAPFDGYVSMVYETKHALGITSEDDTELLIHMGLDTVKLNGAHFTVYVKDGYPIKKGELLAKFELDPIQAEGYQTVTPVIITNAAEHAQVTLLQTGIAPYGTPFLEIR